MNVLIQLHVGKLNLLIFSDIEQLWVELDFSEESDPTPEQLGNESLEVAVRFANTSGTKRRMIRRILSEDFQLGERNPFTS